MQRRADIAEIGEAKSFSYFRIMNGMLTRPGTYYNENLSDHDLKTPFLFLIISIVFNVGASLALLKGSIFISAGILALNAFVMPLITASVSVVIIRIITQSNISFIRIFSIHAFAWGTTLLASWIPMLFLITEPWKWLLITKGFAKGCGLTYFQAITASIIIAGFIICGFYFLMDITS